MQGLSAQGNQSVIAMSDNYIDLSKQLLEEAVRLSAGIDR